MCCNVYLLKYRYTVQFCTCMCVCECTRTYTCAGLCRRVERPDLQCLHTRSRGTSNSVFGTSSSITNTRPGNFSSSKQCPPFLNVQRWNFVFVNFWCQWNYYFLFNGKLLETLFVCRKFIQKLTRFHLVMQQVVYCNLYRKNSSIVNKSQIFKNT